MMDREKLNCPDCNGDPDCDSCSGLGSVEAFCGVPDFTAAEKIRLKKAKQAEEKTP